LAQQQIGMLYPRKGMKKKYMQASIILKGFVILCSYGRKFWIFHEFNKPLI